MNFVVPDFYPAAAEIFVAAMALGIMLASTFARSIARNLSYFLTQATLIGAAFITIFT
ncbi:MAG TPA: NADH:ubiquinone oxidoreductase subunit N, partial [Thauera sp.]|nr:NADH:ubiquinone oxidoreductase subunit N [Thauera sp.]